MDDLTLTLVDSLGHRVVNDLVHTALWVVRGEDFGLFGLAHGFLVSQCCSGFTKPSLLLG